MLTRWREKVYELLVRMKLQEIEDIEHKQDVRKKVSQNLSVISNFLSCHNRR